MNKIFACLTICFALAACTKKSSAPVEPVPPNAIKSDSGDVNRVIISTVVDVPAQFKKNAKPLDVLIWDVKDNRGAVVAIGTMDVEKFPVNVTVRAKDLVRPLDPNSPISVSARLVKIGDETKPPKAGQLVGFMGVSSAELREVVTPENVSKKLLMGAEKKLGLSDKIKRLAIGDSAKIILSPYQF